MIALNILLGVVAAVLLLGKEQQAPPVDHARLRGRDRSHYLHKYNFLRRTQKWDINRRSSPEK